ncbi:hypothetical protein EES42_42650 [Streptomyces sp. ADI95-17]|nr:hypothetical protein EES42_42650 [Streptomyces sp. ADI95-17]
MTTATEMRPSQAVRRSRTSSRGSETNTMPPLPESWSSARARRATTRAPSSNDRPPATQAAAISPWEWPMTAAGDTPQARHSSAREIITAHRTGWTTSTRS